MTKHDPPQLGFDALLSQAEETNRAHVLERETAHLPGTMAEAVPFFRRLIEDHHAAMMAADVDETLHLRAEAARLARKLNGGDPGILAHANAPGYALDRAVAAQLGAVPLWGQSCTFEIEVRGIQVRIEQEGLFSVSSHSFWLGFAARAVDTDRPFLSETGYRSFLGVHVEILPGFTPGDLALHVIASYALTALRGKLLGIAERYR